MGARERDRWAERRRRPVSRRQWPRARLSCSWCPGACRARSCCGSAALDARAPAASAPTRKRGSKAPTEAVIAEEAGKGYHLLLIGVGAGGGGPRRNRRKGRKGQPSGRHGGPSSFRQIGETWVPTSKRSCAMPFESAIDSAFRYEPRSAGASMQRRPFCGN